MLCFAFLTDSYLLFDRESDVDWQMIAVTGLIFFAHIRAIWSPYSVLIFKTDQFTFKNHSIFFSGSQTFIAIDQINC